MSRSDIEGVALENAVIERNLGKDSRWANITLNLSGNALRRPSLHSTTHVYRQRAPALVMRQIGPLRKKCRMDNFIGFEEQKDVSHCSTIRDTTSEVSHRYGSDKYHNPAQGGFVPSRLAQQSFHGLPHDKLSIRIVSPSTEQPKRGSLGVPHRTQRHTLPW